MKKHHVPPSVIARSLLFYQRQIEHQSWWQNCPILCALQLCFWGKHLNTNSLGLFLVISELGSSDYIAKSAIFKILVFLANFWHEITLYAIDGLMPYEENVGVGAWVS